MSKLTIVAIELKNLRKFDDVPNNWTLSLTRQYGVVEMKASVWMDNGYGGREVTLVSQGTSILEVMRCMLDKIRQHTEEFGHRYH